MSDRQDNAVSALDDALWECIDAGIPEVDVIEYLLAHDALIETTKALEQAMKAAL